MLEKVKKYAVPVVFGVLVVYELLELVLIDNGNLTNFLWAFILA